MDPYSWSTMDPNSMQAGGHGMPGGMPGLPTAYGSVGYSYGYGMPMMGVPQAGTFPKKFGNGVARGGGVVKKEWPKKKKLGPPAEKMTCSICNITCTGEQPWQKHLEGKQHKRNEVKALKSGGVVPPTTDTTPAEEVIGTQAAPIKVVGNVGTPATQPQKAKKNPKQIQFVKPGETPSLLGQSFTTESANLDANAAAQPVEGAQAVPQESADSQEAVTTANLNPVPVPESGKHALKCEVCNVIVNGEQPWQAHVNGAKHKKKVEEVTNPGKIRSGGGGGFRGFRGGGRPSRGGGGGRGGFGGGRGGRGRGGAIAGGQPYPPPGGPIAGGQSYPQPGGPIAGGQPYPQPSPMNFFNYMST